MHRTQNSPILLPPQHYVGMLHPRAHASTSRRTTMSPNRLLLVLGLVLVDLEVAERVGVLGGGDDAAGVNEALAET
jgi:hypothetical protein